MDVLEEVEKRVALSDGDMREFDGTKRDLEGSTADVDSE